MKFNKILLFFVFALPVSLALRFFQLFYTVESSTGFFTIAYKSYGNAILWAIFAIAAVTAVFAFFSHRSPEHPPKVNIVLGPASAAFAISVLTELLFVHPGSGAVLWQIILVRILGAATVILFALYAVKDYLNLKINSLFYALPVGYFIMKIICDFASISPLALISDNVLLMGANCFSLIFFLSFAKLYNEIDTERGFRKLLAFGLAAMLLCFTQSVPNIIFNLISKTGYLHTAMFTNIGVLFTGLFISTFIFSHFRYSNACNNISE